eukprot:5776075-Prymnesium_polylepis.1
MGAFLSSGGGRPASAAPTHGACALSPRQLSGSVTSPAKDELDPAGLRTLLEQQKLLFDQAAARLNANHGRVEAHKARVCKALNRDPFAEARSREAAVRD